MITESQMTLLTNWNGQDPFGWWMSEKLNGCRAYWDGNQFWTRSGNAIKAPESITDRLPKIHLDGEIWAGRTGYSKAQAAVEFGKFTPEVEFVCFDAPDSNGTWIERLNSVRQLGVICVDAVLCESFEQFRDLFNHIIDGKGEGIVLRSANAVGYKPGRSKDCLRVNSTTFYRGVSEMVIAGRGIE